MGGYRGRLIWPFYAQIYGYDTAATAAVDPDGPTGPATGGFDPDFREPYKAPDLDLEGPGVTTRVERPPLLLPCQVEVGRFDQRTAAAGGNVPKGQLTLVFHFEDLEEAGLVHPTTGNPALNVGDRLGGIYRRSDSALEQDFTDRPLYATEVQPASFGLSGGRRNLLLVIFDSRDQAPQGGGG